MKKIIALFLSILILTGCSGLNFGDFGGFSNSSSISSSKKDKEIYLVQYVNYDHTLLYEDFVEEGEDSIYQGETPTKPDNKIYTYTFSHWEGNTTNIQKDEIVIAAYTSTVRKYKVVFYNYDGTVLQTTTVKYGSPAIFTEATPTKPETVTSYFTFTGWDQDISYVTEDMHVYPVFEECDKTFVVTFLNYDYSYLGEDIVKYGESTSYNGPTPTKPDDGYISYTFVGWSLDISYVTESMSVVALYSENNNEAKEYVTITYLNGDDTILYTETVEKYTYTRYPFENPTMDSPEEVCCTYNFIYWGDENGFIIEDGINIYATSDLKVYATYQKVAKAEYEDEFVFETFNQFLIVIGYLGNEKEVTIPKGVDVIGLEQNDVSEIQTLNISSTVRHIDTSPYNAKFFISERMYNQYFDPAEWYFNPFRIYTSLTTLNVAKESKYYTAVDNILYSKDKSILYGCIDYDLKNLRIRDETIRIAIYAFESHPSLETLDLNNVKYINNHAFRFSPKLIEVNNTLGLISIGSQSFYDCPKLSKFDLGDDLVYLGNSCLGQTLIDSIYIGKSVILDIYDNANPLAIGCSNIKNITVSPLNEYYAVDGEALYTKDFSRLISYYSENDTYTINEICNVIGPQSFNLKTNLSNVFFGPNVKTIGGDAFSGCAIKEFILPDSLETIREYAFSGSEVESIHIGPNVSYIGHQAFDNNKFMESLTLDPTNQYFEMVDGVLYTDDLKELVWYPTYLTYEKYQILDTTEVLRMCAIHFYDENCLKEIVIPNSVTTFNINSIYGLHLNKCTYLGTTEQWNNIYFEYNIFESNTIESGIICDNGVIWPN